MNYRNPYKNKDGFINCEVNHPKYGWIPFQASPDDTVQHGRALYVAMNNDPNLIHETDEQYAERKALLARVYRNRLLTNEVDPLLSNQIRFNELSEDKQNEWKAYRTALLDIPLQEGFPHDIIWPTKPE